MSARTAWNELNVCVAAGHQVAIVHFRGDSTSRITLYPAASRSHATCTTLLIFVFTEPVFCLNVAHFQVVMMVFVAFARPTDDALSLI